MVNDDESIISNVCEEIVDHLEILSKSFNGYFGGELETSKKYIINRYSFNSDFILHDEKFKDDFIELRTNRVVEMQFESKTLEQY